MARDLAEQALKSYDPAYNTGSKAHYDPAYAKAQSRQKFANFVNEENAAQIDINITSNIVGGQSIVLFDALRPLWVYNNQDPPILPAGTTASVDAATGNVVYPGAGGTQAIISCQVVPYYTLVQSTLVTPFSIIAMRYSSVTATQYNNQVSLYRRTFLGGWVKNPLSPKSYVSPYQYQGQIVDIPINIDIDNETAIVVKVNNGETITFSLFLGDISKPTTL